MTIQQLLTDGIVYSEIKRDKNGKAIKSSDGNFRRTYYINQIFSSDFDHMIDEIDELMADCRDMLQYENILLRLYNDLSGDQILYMEEIDHCFNDKSNLDLLQMLDRDFSAFDCFFRVNDLGLIESFSDLKDCPEVEELVDIIRLIEEDCALLREYIEGSFYDGIDILGGRMHDVVEDFIEFLSEQPEEELTEMDLYIMAQA